MPESLKFNTHVFVDIVASRLEREKQVFANLFSQSGQDVGTRYLKIDNLLPEETAIQIYQAFLEAPEVWREMKSFRERKLTTKQFDRLPSILGEVTFAFQNRKIISLVEQITGIKGQVGDPKLYAGGLSTMREGDFLDPHIDNSHDQERKFYRRLNLLYYVTPGWQTEDGGHLELWDAKVKNKVTLESKFNRLVIMETNHRSWHSVSKVRNVNGRRCCVSNYYFSKQSPLDHQYFHVTSFNGRPEEPLKRVVCKVDNFLRKNIRMLKKSGLGIRDVYQG